MKKLSYVFILLAILLSNIMSASVAFNYCNLLWGIEYKGYSASANTAFLLIIPYGIGIIACSVIALLLYKKTK